MSQNKNNSKTIWIIVGVIVGVLIIGGLIIGIVFYSLYKIGTSQISPSPVSSTNVQTGILASYENNRFGFTFKYPSSFNATESQNGDGATLTTNDPPLTIRAYGSNNALNQTLDEYLNWVRENLFKEQANGEEILAENITLGEISAKERQWTYTNSVDGSKTLLDQITALENNTFYSIEMVIASADNDEYAAHVFDNIIASFKIE